MTLDDLLANLRDTGEGSGEEEQSAARRNFLEEVLSAEDTDLNALSAAIKDKGSAVDPSAGDISEEAVAEFELLAQVGEAVNARIASIEEQRERDKRAAHAAKLAARIAETKMLDSAPADQGVTASTHTPDRRPASSTPQASRRETVHMTAASDMPGFFSGQAIGDMSQLTAAIISRARSLSRSGSGRQVPLVTLNRQVPETHLITDEHQDWTKLVHATNERRLPGGSLAASLLKRQTALTASTPVPIPPSGGYAWCAPMELRDELCPVEGSLDGLLDLPTIVTQRGGVMWPTTPDFSDLYTPFCFSDQDAGPGYDIQKPCVQLPCPEGFDECRLQACSLCLETGIIQARVAPEQVQRAITELLIAHQHHLNRMRIQAMLDDISAQPGGHTDVTDFASHGPGLIESLLSFVELQATHLRERRRLAFDATIEAVFPRWALSVLKSDLSKKNAIPGRWLLGEQDVISYLLQRGIRPQFIRGWQDEQLSGDEVPIEWPGQVSFMLFQAGAFVAISGPSIQFEMIHDKALLQANREIRLFAEDLFCVIRRCGQAKSFTVPLCPNGLSGGQVNDGPCPPPAPAPAVMAASVTDPFATAAK